MVARGVSTGATRAAMRRASVCSYARLCPPGRISPPPPPPRKSGKGRERAHRRSHGVIPTLLVTALLGLAGCGPIPEVEHGEARAVDVHRDVAGELGRSQAPRIGHRILKVETRRPYTGLKPVAVEVASGLPEEFLGEDGISLPLAHALTPAEMGQHITASTGLPLRFVGRPLGERAGAAHFTGRGGRVLGAAGRWTGPLADLLDEWTDDYGYGWRYDADSGVIEVIRELSAVFGLRALGGEQQFLVRSSTVGGSASVGKTRTADHSSQRLDTSYQYNPWPEIEETVRGLVSEGAVVVVSPVQATVTVRGLPRDVARIREYLRYLNKTVLRPIVVTVRVLSVVRDAAADFETDFSAALRSIGGGSLDLVFEGGRGTRSVGVVRPGAEGAENSVDVTLRALRSLGTVTRVLSAGVPSLNGAPAQYYELVRHTYLSEISTTVADGGVEQQLKPGAISSGFAMSYVGRITGPGEVLLRIFAGLQDVPTYTTFGTISNQIQLPQFGSRGISVTQTVREGETLVLSGFSDRSLGTEREGFVRADNPVAGATTHADRRVDQVLLVTSRIGEPAGVSEVSEVRL